MCRRHTYIPLLRVGSVLSPRADCARFLANAIVRHVDQLITFFLKHTEPGTGSLDAIFIFLPSSWLLFCQ